VGDPAHHALVLLGVDRPPEPVPHGLDQIDVLQDAPVFRLVQLDLRRPGRSVSALEDPGQPQGLRRPGQHDGLADDVPGLVRVAEVAVMRQRALEPAGKRSAADALREASRAIQVVDSQSSPQRVAHRREQPGRLVREAPLARPLLEALLRRL